MFTGCRHVLPVHVLFSTQLEILTGTQRKGRKGLEAKTVWKATLSLGGLRFRPLLVSESQLPRCRDDSAEATAKKRFGFARARAFKCETFQSDIRI